MLESEAPAGEKGAAKSSIDTLGNLSAYLTLQRCDPIRMLLGCGPGLGGHLGWLLEVGLGTACALFGTRKSAACSGAAVNVHTIGVIAPSQVRGTGL
jgi:hypothetical protein